MVIYYPALYNDVEKSREHVTWKTKVSVGYRR